MTQFLGFLHIGELKQELSILLMGLLKLILNVWGTASFYSALEILNATEDLSLCSFKLA